MGGEITVESALGQGAIFTLHLPIRAAPAEPEPDVEPEEELVSQLA